MGDEAESDVALSARKLLARKKMRDILLKSAYQDETDAIEREQAFLTSLLDSARDGDIDTLTRTLEEKIANLEKRKPANRIAKEPGAQEQLLKLADVKDETKLQELLKKYAKGDLVHDGLCDPVYWSQFACGLHITPPAPANGLKKTVRPWDCVLSLS